MEEWETYKLRDLIMKVIDNRGKSVPVSTDMYQPLIEINALGGYSPNYSQVKKYVSKETYENWFRSGHPQIGDILIPTVGTIGIVSIMTENKGCIAQNVIGLRVKDFVCPEYILYFLKSERVKKEMLNLNIGGVQPSIKVPHLMNMNIALPPLKKQNQIAYILRSLDEKIELNNRINHNLEEQAQALYKSWFVDFEPFKGGKFVDSELGMIPEGWRVGCYNDIISSTVSGDWGKDREVGNYTHKVSCIRGCDFADVSSGIRGKTPERFILEKNFKHKRLIDKDIIVEISGGTPTVSTGRICLVSDNLLDKYSGNIVCTNFCRVIRPCSGYSSYVFYSWLDKYNGRVMFGYENGTSGIKNFQISDFMEKEPVIIPPQTVIAKFQTIVEFYQAVIQRNGNERMECETVRDTLLPKLMSGELIISDLTC